MEAELAELQARVTAERTRVKSETLAAIGAMLESGTLTPDDLLQLLPESEAKAPKRSYANRPPKYRDPQTGATWTGQGAAPAWLKDKNRDDYLINGA
jgi:DNA-binding protein H-NS